MSSYFRRRRTGSTHCAGYPRDIWQPGLNQASIIFFFISFLGIVPVPVQCHEIFDLEFCFYQSIPSGLVVHILEPYLHSFLVLVSRITLNDRIFFRNTIGHQYFGRYTVIVFLTNAYIKLLWKMHVDSAKFTRQV